MRVVGFNYTKISAERKKTNLSGLKIDTVINLKNIEDFSPKDIKTKDNLIKVSFQYDIKYNPEIAEINLGGELILSMDSKESKEILKSWKDKSLGEEKRILLLNIIMRRTSVKALDLEEQIGVPFHFNMPSLRPNKK